MGELEQVSDILYLMRFPGLFQATCPLVAGERYIFLLDTYLGPLSMTPVLSFLQQHRKDRELFVVNSHSHFDHIWGNSAFSGAPIISHLRCRQKMLADAASEYERLLYEMPEWVKEEVEIVYPDTTFTERLFFHDPLVEIELFHLPGHSSDSVAIFLEPSKVLLAADSVEDPFPLLSESGREANIDLYLKNLGRLKRRKPVQIICGHGFRTDPGLIDDNIRYLEKLRFQVEMLLKDGTAPDEKRVPISLCLPDCPGISPFYHQAHIANIGFAARYLESRGR